MQKLSFLVRDQASTDFSNFHSDERDEYVALTVRQLRAGLLRLATSCRGGASVFAVGCGLERDQGQSGSFASAVSVAPCRPGVFRFA